MLAKYSGLCVECDGRIEANVDEIVQIDNVWMHEECAPELEIETDIKTDIKAEARYVSNK